jgi:type II secretory pathway component GspD/PulD (secretin)
MNVTALAALFLFSLPLAVPEKPTIRYEVRILSVPVEAELKALSSKDGGTAFLDDAELKTVLDTAQALRRANAMQAPKITADHDQPASVSVVDKKEFVTSIEATAVRGQSVFVPKQTTVEVGMKLNLRGRASADGKFVSVDVKHADTRVEKVELVPLTMFITPVFEGGSQGQPIPFTQFLQTPHLATTTIEKKALAIPSGGHAAITGPTYQTEIREDVRIPLLSELPYISRMFQNERLVKQKMRTILIVSPTVVPVAE